MNSYLIIVKTYAPYPIEKTYRIAGSNFGTAIRRGVQLYRKEEIARKKIKEIFVKAIRI